VKPLMRIRATGKVKGNCPTFGTFYGPECSLLWSALAYWSGSKDSSSALNLYIYGQQYRVVSVDVDETRAGLTPDYESAFIRSLLESSGARVLNAFSDDEGAFQGPKASLRRTREGV